MATPYRQLQLSVKNIELIDAGTKIPAPEGAVYSTSPKKAEGIDGNTYIIKGPEIEIVAAEVCGHLLAGLVDLLVPDFAIAQVDGTTYFASREMQIRNAERFIRRMKIENPTILLETVTFDVWLANHDRNIWNFVGECSSNSPAAKLYAIDFEKSAAISDRTPIVKIPMLNPQKFWPRGDLGQLMAGKPRPDEFLAKIRAITHSQIVHCVSVATAHLPEFTWAESTIHVLESRTREIDKLCKEVWR